MSTAAITTEGDRGEAFNAKWCCRFRECACNSEPEELAPEGTKYEATSFSQDFSLGNGKLTEEELVAMQNIYESYTPEFSNVEASEITTSCFVNYLSYQDGDASLYLEFNMLFESEYYSVLNYKMLFQNWATQHSSDILEDLQTLGGWNVTNMTDPVWIFSTEGPPEWSSTVETGESHDSSDESIQSSSQSSRSFNFIPFIIVTAVGALFAVGTYLYKRVFRRR